MCQNHHIHTKPGKCNTQEHKKWNRRSFLQAMGLVGGGTIALANTALSVTKTSALSAALNTTDNDRVLVLIRLKGGNDGLNTIVPLNQYDAYANARPNIRMQQNEIFKLSDDYAMPTYANKFERMWGEGQMKIIHGVGYEDSSLSHFKGSDIWATSDLNEDESTGWMGRYFESLYPDYLFNPPEKPAAIQIGSSGNLIFNGDDSNFAFSVADPRKLYEIAQNGTLYDLNNLPDCTHGNQVGFMKGIANTTFAYAEVINEAYESSQDYGNYPDNNLSKQLSVVSRLIKGNLGTKVYLVTLGGFDTHNDQRNRQEQLITQLSETVSYFYEDLAEAGYDDKVVSLTISEFGRRVKENGSRGTDHGTSAPMMVYGTALEGNGFIGEHPDLTDLNRTGNMKNTTDFRQVYASLLKEWLCVDAGVVNQVLLGQEYDPFELGFTCQTSTDEENEETDENGGDTGGDVVVTADIFDHKVTYEGNQSYLHLSNGETGHIDVSLFNMTGKKVATLKNEMMVQGNYIIDVKKEAKTRLAEGFYAYRIIKGKYTFSKSIMIL